MKKLVSDVIRLELLLSTFTTQLSIINASIIVLDVPKDAILEETKIQEGQIEGEI